MCTCGCRTRYTAAHGPINDQQFSPSDPHAELCCFNPRGGGTSERQRDAQTREVKCVVNGITLGGATAEAVVKIGFTGKLVVITVYLC